MIGLHGALRAAILLGAVGGVAAFAAPVAWHMLGESRISPAAPRQAPAPGGAAAPPPVDIAPILALAPFGALPPPAEETAQAPAAALDLTLRGIVQAADPARSIAVISGPDSTLSYRPGEPVPGGALLARIETDHVVLSEDGRERRLAFREETLGAEEVPDTAETPDAPSGFDRLRALADAQAAQEPDAAGSGPQTVDDYISLWRKRIQTNPQQVLDTIGLIASDEGYVIAQKHDSGVRLAGLRPGDLVARVNGEQVGNVANDTELFDRLSAADVVRLEVERGDETITMSFPLK
ncbi:type II secretion system protein N [Profundibacterium mesophilum]|uniref:XphA n=1 Tax=Profundibacterium mesophilum KAUST100406-0324 TaxID=1037889 RepID=A0A921TBL3_9RHOB|nr:type II secretion system protein N [Profundibacterium mesophilum]KAF0675840.1 XphA [Profundibacterium mesophilum KAUST100406-0324]